MSAELHTAIHKVARDETASIIVNGYRDRLVKQVRQSIEALRNAQGMEAPTYISAVIAEMKKIGRAFNELEGAEDDASARLMRSRDDPRLDRIRRLEAEIGVVERSEQ